jgi:hypothetical protein
MSSLEGGSECSAAISLRYSAARWHGRLQRVRNRQRCLSLVRYPRLHPTSRDITAAFERGLAESGYVVGRNVTIERRWARGNYDGLPELAQVLVRLDPSLIMAGGNVVALAVRRATSTIPIVFNIASDPVKLGLAKASLILQATPRAYL